jgi:Chaperone of endosialidase
VNPVSFTFKTRNESDLVPLGQDGDYHIGFIAEEVKAAGIPTDVMIGGLDALSIPDLIAVLWCKVQEQDQRIAELEARP